MFGKNFAESQQKEIPMNDSFEVFKMLLNYLYKGKLDLRVYGINDLADLLELSHRYEITSLEKHIKEYLFFVVNPENCVTVLEIAKIFHIERLEELCWNFVEMIIEGVYDVELDLSLDILAELVFQRERRVAEINLFKVVAKLTSIEGFCTEEDKNDLLSSVNLEIMNTMELSAIVMPTNLYNESYLLEVFQKICLKNANKIYSNMKLEEKTQVFAPSGSQHLFSSDSNFTSFIFDEAIAKKENFILIELYKISIFNYIKFKLSTGTNGSLYSYIVDVSKDSSEWTNVVDYSKIQCGGIQHLFFPETRARFVKITVTKCYKSNVFQCNSFKLFFVENPSKFLGGFSIPYSNVAVYGRAFLFNYNGILHFDKTLLSNKFVDNGSGTPFSQQTIGKPILIDFGQPYILSSCRMRFWDWDDCKYSYKVEISLDKEHFEVISDKSDVHVGGWQEIVFSPRPVSRFRITGISATKGNTLRLVYFESPSQLD